MKFNLKEALILGSMALIFFSSCSNNSDKQILEENDSLKAYVAERLPIYAKVRLKTDIEKLSGNERKVLPLLIKAAEIMDELFWLQAYPQRDSLLSAVEDEKTREFIKINYGPWDRLNDNKPFVKGIGDKPLGSGFYPANMTREELEKSDVSDKKGLYSMIRRNESGKLISIPYSVYFKDELKRAADLLLQAAQITEETQLKKYLTLRAEAFLTDNYMPSDFAWMDMTNSGLDIIIGPIENYEDGLFNARAAFESYVLVKDKEWSKRLEKYVAMLPELQRGLPVDAAYKMETPGTSSQLAAFDVVYYAVDGNSVGKTIAVNLPNCERIPRKRGPGVHN